MQIEIRVWNKNLKKMYYPTEVNDLMILIGDSGFYQVQDHFNFDIKTAKYKDLNIADSLESDLVMMVGIGLKDKNGVDIYEDDILRGPFRSGIGGKSTKSKDFNFSVIWDNHSAGFTQKMPENYGIYRFLPDWGECEVIGNIHQNPELL